MGIGEMEAVTPRNLALLSLSPFAAAQAWDFNSADPTDYHWRCQ